MRTYFFIFLCLLPLGLLGAQEVRAAYFASWTQYEQPELLKNLPAEKLTHLLYAFAIPEEDGSLRIFDPWGDLEKDYGLKLKDYPWKGSFSQVQSLRLKNPDLKILISLGGWSGSKWFSDIVADPQKSLRFYESQMAFVRRFNFDGIDIDWEFPVKGGASGNSRSAQDPDNLIRFLQGLRLWIKEHRLPDEKEYLLSLALPPAKSQLEVLDLAKLAVYCDYINLMAYNYRGTWDGVPGHHSGLYPDIAQGLDYILAQGLEPGKLILGLPLFARAWTLPEASFPDFRGLSGSGLIKTLNLTALKSEALPPAGDRAAGTYSWTAINRRLSREGLRLWDDQAKVPVFWLEKERLFVSWDDQESLFYKKRMVKDKGLAGFVFWDLAGDSDYTMLNYLYQLDIK